MDLKCFPTVTPLAYCVKKIQALCVRDKNLCLFTAMLTSLCTSNSTEFQAWKHNPLRNTTIFESYSPTEPYGFTDQGSLIKVLKNHELTHCNTVYSDAWCYTTYVEKQPCIIIFGGGQT